MSDTHSLLLILADSHPAQKTHGPRVALKVAHKSNLLDSALSAGIAIQTLCGGARACRMCHVLCEEGVSEISDEEAAVLEEIGCAAGVRLACQVEIVGDAKVHVPFAPEL